MHFKAVRLIVIKDQKVLLVKETGKDYWGFPGGGVNLDENETLEAALRREITEEIGLSISNLKPYT